MAFGGTLPGSNPGEAKARAIQRQLEAKRASREYDKHCSTCGISPLEARLLAPPLVKKGAALRGVDERHRQRDLIKAKKEKLDNKFGRQSSSA